MSQHPSLSSSTKSKRHRSVLKRFERLRILKDKDKWEDDDSIFGLPKIKIVKVKVKKGKAAEAPATAAEEKVETVDAGVTKKTTEAKVAVKKETESKKEKKEK